MMMKGASLALCAFVGGLLPHHSNAHGRLISPTPRSTRVNGQTLSSSDQNAPTGNSPLSESFVCRDTAVSPEAEWLEVEAGSVLPMQWELSAKHIGDCFVYISCTPDLPDLEKEWFKIADLPYCRDPSKENLAQSMASGMTDGSLGGPLSGVPVDIAIPDFLGASDHCILRWEWYALHQVTSVEYYAQCVDIKVTANSAGAAVAAPEPTFTIGDASFRNLRNPGTDATQNYRKGFLSGNQFLSSDIALVSPSGGGPAPTSAPPSPTSTPPSPTPAPPSPTFAPPSPTPAPPPSGSSCEWHDLAGLVGDGEGNDLTTDGGRGFDGALDSAAAKAECQSRCDAASDCWSVSFRDDSSDYQCWLKDKQITSESPTSGAGGTFATLYKVCGTTTTTITTTTTRTTTATTATAAAAVTGAGVGSQTTTEVVETDDEIGHTTTTTTMTTSTTAAHEGGISSASMASLSTGNVVSLSQVRTARHLRGSV